MSGRSHSVEPVGLSNRHCWPRFRRIKSEPRVVTTTAASHVGGQLLGPRLAGDFKAVDGAWSSPSLATETMLSKSRTVEQGRRAGPSRAARRRRDQRSASLAWIRTTANEVMANVSPHPQPSCSSPILQVALKGAGLLDVFLGFGGQLGGRCFLVAQVRRQHPGTVPSDDFPPGTRPASRSSCRTLRRT